MRLIQLATNQTELALNNGLNIFFSYNTPVAAFIPGTGYVRTNKKWSVTTSTHINRWVGTIEAKKVPQSFFDELLINCKVPV